MDYRSFDITVSSLEAPNTSKTLTIPLFKPRFYAVVSLNSSASGRQMTPLRKPLGVGGGKIHVCNYPMRLYVEYSEIWRNSAVAVIKLRQRGLCMDTDVGQVYVPLKELLDNYNSLNDIYSVKLNPISTAAQRVSKEYNLHFSYKFSNVFRAVKRRVSGGDEAASTVAKPWFSASALSAAPYLGDAGY